MKTLHLHGQYTQHLPARITGTREALEILQKAINQLISSSSSEKEIVLDMECFDGEEYELTVQMQSNLEKDNLPYSSWKEWHGENV